jgi:hypothetical protein
MNDPYEREGAKAAIHTMQRELAEAREKATTAWSDNLILDSRNRQLERELAEARVQRDTLKNAIKEMASQKLVIEMDDFDMDRADWQGAYDEFIKKARAAVKGGSHE